MRSYYLLFLFTIIISFAQAEEKETRDTNFISAFSKKYALRFFFGSRHTEFSIRPNGNQDSIKVGTINYKPNVGYFLGIGGSYRHTGINISFRIPYSDRDDAMYGKTRYTDLRLLIYGVHYGGQIYYKKYNGFYITNPQNIDATWKSGNPLPQRPDIVLEDVGAEIYYVFNKEKYSLRSVFRQTEKQIKNAHSFLIRVDASALSIFGSTSLIPKNLDKYYGSMSGLKSGNFMIAGILGGYTSCTVIKKDYFISPTILVGPAYYFRKYNTYAGEVSRDDLGAKLNIKLALGYNTKDIFTGFLFESNNDLIREREMKLTTSVFSFNLFVGYRFRVKNEDRMIFGRW